MCSVANSLLNSPANREIAVHNPFDNLPDEIILNIFSFLSPEDLARTSVVCKRWCGIAEDETLRNNLRNNLKQLFPGLQAIIDRTVWSRYVDLPAFELSFDDVEPLNSRTIILVLKTHFHDVDQAKVKVEKNAGWTVVELPKGLNFNKLVTLAKSPKQGNITPFILDPMFIHNDQSVPDELKERTVQKTYRFMMTNAVLERSKLLNFGDQEKLTKAVECEMPEFLEVASLVALTHMTSSVKSPIRLYSDQSLTYTRCREQVDDDITLIVGGFCFPENVGNVDLQDSVRLIDWYKDGNDTIGVAAVRRLPEFSIAHSSKTG